MCNQKNIEEIKNLPRDTKEKVEKQIEIQKLNKIAFFRPSTQLQFIDMNIVVFH